MASNNDQAATLRLIYRNIVELRNNGPHSQAKYKCKIDRDPFSGRDEDDPPAPADWVIEAQIFPLNQAVYNGRPVRIRITLPPTYPLAPPEVRLVPTVFHPNVEKDGRVCASKIFSGSTYEPKMTLVDVINEVTQILDNPSIDLLVNAEAASVHSTDRTQYEEKARETFLRNP